MYLICWNQSPVSDWIDKMVTQDYYNETLVLETLKLVNQDVSTNCGISFCVPALVTLYTIALLCRACSTVESSVDS